MKTTRKRTILPFVTIILGSLMQAQTDTLELYLQPDLQSEKVDTVEAGDPRLGPGLPVPDEASAAIGWHFADFKGTINGFIPDAKIGKDLFPVENAIIYAGASSESPVIDTYHKGDQLEIVDTGAWWEVRLTTVFPVYYIVDPATSSPSAGPLSIETMPILEQPAPATGKGIVLGEGPPPRIPDNITGQSYQGTFRKSKRGLGLFSPLAPFYLEDSRGGRLAWVDTSGLVGPGTLDRYMNQTVIIYGERELEARKKEWIIRARNMRLK